MAKFVSQRGTVRAIRDMNIRLGSPSVAGKAVPAEKNALFGVIGHVTDGDKVSGNALWYRTADDKYIWSGNVEFVKDASVRILHSPLAQLVCTQRFGLRPEVYKDYGCPKGHNGLDFRTWVNGNAAKWKQAVFAVLGGNVYEAAYDAKFKGNFVRIRHDNGYESVYLHLDSLKVKKGDSVVAGQQIGVSGNTGGASEAPHLHFGYRPTKCDVNDGYMGYVNPVNLFIDDITFV